MTQESQVAEKPKDDLPTPEQQKEFETTVRKILNPDGENKQMDQYVTNTFDYISNMFDKMQKAPDPELAAKEIAEDLKQKFENWADSQKEKQGEKTETTEVPDKTETAAAPEKTNKPE